MKLTSTLSKNLFFTFSFALIVTSLNAQCQTITQADGDYPVKAEPGKCYAKCYAPDQYEMQTIQVVDKQATQRYVTIPEVYETVVDTILVKPSAITYETVPPVFSMVTDTIQISGETTRWVKGKADPNCLSDNPDNCRVMCLEVIPAQYSVQMRKIISAPAYSKSIEIAAEYKYVPRRVLKTPRTTQVIDLPATFKTVTQNVMVKKGGFGEWREILCASKLNEAKILQIQQALRAKGYNPGAIDNVLGYQTKAALIQFQKNNHLPEGNLNLETLTALGVN